MLEYTYLKLSTVLRYHYCSNLNTAVLDKFLEYSHKFQPNSNQECLPLKLKRVHIKYK